MISTAWTISSVRTCSACSTELHKNGSYAAMCGMLLQNGFAKQFIQYMREVQTIPNLVDMKKISEICVEMNQWTVKKWSHTASLQDGICCNMQSSQYLVWPGFFGSRTNTSISPQRKSKTKLHERLEPNRMSANHFREMPCFAHDEFVNFFPRALWGAAPPNEQIQSFGPLHDSAAPSGVPLHLPEKTSKNGNF